MDIHDLKKNIERLQNLRDVHHSQLDAGALAELDDVLQQLKGWRSQDGGTFSLENSDYESFESST